MMGFTDGRLAILTGRTETDIRERAAIAWCCCLLQADRHLRGRI